MITLNTPSSYRQMSIAELKKHCLSHFSKHLANKTVKNKQTGLSIILSKQGAKHAMFARASGFEKIVCLTIIDKIIVNAGLRATEAAKHNNIIGVMKFSAMVNVDGVKLEISVFVRITSRGRFYYDHVAVL